MERVHADCLTIAFILVMQCARVCGLCVREGDWGVLSGSPFDDVGIRREGGPVIGNLRDGVGERRGRNGGGVSGPLRRGGCGRRIWKRVALQVAYAAVFSLFPV